MKHNLALLLVIILKIALGFALINHDFELHRDEFLHLDQANHPAFGYLSVPPLTSWFAMLVQLLGNGVFWVKFFPSLFGALTIALVWKTVEYLGGSWFALLTAATSLLLSAMMRLNMLFQPNSFEILAWTIVCFCLLRYVRSQHLKWMYWAALGLGLGFLNKYNIAFLAAGILPGFLLVPQRKLLFRTHVWWAGALAFGLILPNLIWQLSHDLPVLHHMAELKATQLVHVSAASFLKEQLFFFFGSIHVLIASLLSLLLYKPFRDFRFLLWGFCISIALFLYLNAKGYYAFGLYPILFAFGSVYLEKRLRGKAGMILQSASMALPVGFFVIIYPLAFPVDTPAVIAHRMRHSELQLTRWEDQKLHDLPQDFADMLGWKELAAITDAALASLPKKEHTIIICDNYGQTGAINYYKKDDRTQAVSFNADYLDWFELERPIQNIILVKEAQDSDPEHLTERQYFDSVRKAGEITTEFAREKGTAVIVLKGANIDVNAFLTSEIAAQKAAWR